jgi:hypothetical protein
MTTLTADTPAYAKAANRVLPRPIARSLRTVVLALFTLDMLFLPMFHVRGLPFKPFYVVVAAYVVAVMSSRPIRAMVGWCWGLATICWIGAFYLFILEDGARVSETARNSLVWFLTPLAFAFGWQHRRARINFLMVFIALYFLLNLVLTYTRVPALISFYGLEDRITTGVFDYRSPGIHYNPNLSALAINLMLLATVLAERHGVIRVRVTVRWLVFSCVIGTHMLLGSRGEFAAALLLGAVWTYYVTGAHRRQRLLRFLLVGGTAAVIFLAVFRISIDYLATRSHAFSYARNQFTAKTTLAAFEQFADEQARANSVLLRPFLAVERGYDRFLKSPVWGTGFDSGLRYPFESTYFHNDWMVILVAGGVIGFLFFIGVLTQLSTLGLAVLLPFFITAPFNTFILAPQHMMFYFAMAGVLAGAISQRTHFAQTREKRASAG